MTADPIRVLIADDHPIVREGLEMVINSQPNLALVGQAANGKEVLSLFKELQPDVIVMDLKMPQGNGLDAVEQIRKSGSQTPILVLTSFPDDEMLISAIQLGANGIMLKESESEQLVKAIFDVANGQSSLHPLVAGKLMENIRRSGIQEQQAPVLTDRERDVMRCLAQGLSNQEIALKLSISTRTVTTHVRNILDKLNLNNRTQAALYAIDKGLIEK